MSLRPTSDEDLDVLLVTPTRRDAELIHDALNVSNVQSEAVKDVASAVEVFRTRDIGALMIAEEALGKDQIALLTSALAKQPARSALPVLVLTMGGKETFQSRRQEQERLSLGYITLLERPIRVATLLSSVKAALYARSRQYERRLSETVLRQSEKLALVGRLASSIAHEINNPFRGFDEPFVSPRWDAFERGAAGVFGHSSAGARAGLANCGTNAHLQSSARYQRGSICLCTVGFSSRALSRTAGRVANRSRAQLSEHRINPLLPRRASATVCKSDRQCL